MRRVRPKGDDPESSFTAGDVQRAAGLSYRQLNDWDSKGALPNSRAQESCWRRFTVRELFELMVCAEIRRRFCVPIEKLASLRSYMLHEGKDHFKVAARMVQHGLAVFVLTDLLETFDIGADIAIADMLALGYCRYDDPQAYILLHINPIVNKILAALKKPARWKISDNAYKARREGEAVSRAQDDAELAVLEAMRNPNFKRFSVTRKGQRQILLEMEQELPDDTHINMAVSSHDFQTFVVKRRQGKTGRISRTEFKKISRERIRTLVTFKLDK
jgi:DNA-binding transcriptional MerR regulator